MVHDNFSSGFLLLLLHFRHNGAGASSWIKPKSRSATENCTRKRHGQSRIVVVFKFCPPKPKKGRKQTIHYEYD
jgi:hypothetical protein